MELRPNQTEPVRIGIEFFRQTKPVPSIIVAPTAFGKSICIAKIAEQVDGNLLIIQPSKELLEQNFHKYTMLGGKAAIYSASFGSRRISKVTYATIGSIKTLGIHFKQMGFRKMIVDEAHLYPRNSDSMIGKFLMDSEITHVLGLTATPLKLQSNFDLAGNQYSKLVMLTSRSKKGQFYKDIIYVAQVSEMVTLGYWSKLEYEQFDIDESGLEYNSTKAEYTEESIEQVYKSNNIHAKVIAKVKQLQGIRRNILVFVPSVADAISLSQQVPDSATVYGDMKDQERDYVIASFREGRIKTVFNVNVLSVGFDHPQVDAIICARSTASLAWYYQALGRGTRIHHSKKDCLIVDFSGNVKRFGKIENLYYKKETVWKLYGEGGKLLSGCPIHEVGQHTDPAVSGTDQSFKMPFGKHKGKAMKDVPKKYREWMLKEFKWDERNDNIRQEILKLQQVTV